jgi:hypothetical protein
MLEIRPFVKIAWNSDTIRKQWCNVLDSIKRTAFDSEYEMVKSGLRKANVYHMSPQNFDKEIEKITRDGFVFLPMVRSKTYRGFSHRHYPVKELDFNCFVYGVVAKDLETAQEFVDASKNGDHVTIGQLLGYPRCCCNAFQENWMNKKILDPCYEAAINTTGNMKDEIGVHVKVNPFINPMLRYFGIKIAPFFPCSFSCEEAIKVGETWFNLMKILNDEAAVTTKEILKQPMSWSLRKSIIYIKTPLFIGIVNGYDCETQKDIVANEFSEKEEAVSKD